MTYLEDWCSVLYDTGAVTFDMTRLFAILTFHVMKWYENPVINIFKIVHNWRLNFQIFYRSIIYICLRKLNWCPGTLALRNENENASCSPRSFWAFYTRLFGMEGQRLEIKIRLARVTSLLRTVQLSVLSISSLCERYIQILFLEIIEAIQIF